MGFDAVLELVMDGPNRQIVLQFPERLLDLDQLEIEPPEMAGVVAPDVGAKQIAAFTPPGDAKLLAVQREMERLRGDRLILRRRMDRQQPVGLAGLLFGCAELQQQLVARQVLPLQFAQAFDQLAQPTPPHRLFLLAPGLAAGEDVGLLLLFDQLDPHALAHVFPRLGRKRLFPAWSAVRAACPRDSGWASARLASPPGPPRSGCRDPSPRCVWRCRIAPRSWPEKPAASSCPRCCRP